MIAAIRAMQIELGVAVCSGIDDQGLAQQIITLQKYLSTIPDAGQPSGYRFDPALVMSNIADHTIPRAIIQLQNVVAAPVTPSLISASIRFQVPGTTSNAWFGQQISSNGYTYTRVGDRAVKAVTGIRKLYTTIGISTSSTLPSYIENQRHEQGTCGQQVRAHTLLNLSGTALNQGSATVYTDTFNDLVNDVTFTSGSRTYTMSQWLDNTVTPPVYRNRTYAQFVAAGGVVSSSTVNGGSLANSQVYVPRGWSVWTDRGPDLAADTMVFHGLEQRSPIVAVTSITAASGSMTINTSNTDIVAVGDIGTVASATGNVSVNVTGPVTAVVPNTSITITVSSITTGAVTGSPTLRFTYPTHAYNGQVTFNPLGDYQKSSATQLDKIGTGDWTSIGATSLADGGFGPGFAAIIGTDATGSENVIVLNDSIAWGKGDNVINDPAGAQAGDAAGNMGFYPRALYRERIPSIRAACPSESSISEFSKQDNQFRLYLAGLAEVILTNDGHNTVFGYSTYAPFKTTMVSHWDTYRAAGRGIKPRVVTNTLNAFAGQVSADHWKTARNATYQTNGNANAAFTYPTGYVYANFHSELTSGTLVTGTTGGVDGYIDIAQYDSNIFGEAPIDGYKAVDGVTDYGGTIDGTHNSMTGNINIAAQITRPALVAAKVVLH
jgi:hypothetical protein